MVTLVILADRMIPTEEIQKVSSRYLDWFRFYEIFFVKNPTNCPIIECLPYWGYLLQMSHNQSSYFIKKKFLVVLHSG